MLWDLSVRNTSLPFDHTCCLDKSELGTCLSFPVSREAVIERYDRSRPFSFLFFQQVQFDAVRQHLDLRHKRHTNSCKQHVLNLHVLVSLCSLEFFGFILTLDICASKGSSSSSFPISTSARDSPTGSMSSPIGATSRFRVFVGLTSALLCHTRFQTADHRSHCWSLSISLLDSSRN